MTEMQATTIRSLCVYCGSSVGVDPIHQASAAALGRVMAAEGVRLVFGGGAVGLMGVVADSVMEAGGEVFGVMPKGLFKSETGHQGITKLVEVDSMHERKLLMAAESDAFIALPGGLGTLEELAEITTWAQIGIHDKPVGVLDIDGFWSPLFEFLDQMVTAGFLRPAIRELIVRMDDVNDVLPMLRQHRQASREQLLALDET